MLAYFSYTNATVGVAGPPLDEGLMCQNGQQIFTHPSGASITSGVAE
jgi:hypothetical protein